MINPSDTSVYFRREFNNDLPKGEPNSTPIALGIRVGKAALPFACLLFQPFGQALALGFGSARVLTNTMDTASAKDLKQLALPAVNTAIAVAAVVATILCHPVGMMVTTVNDIGLNLIQAYHLGCQGEYLEMGKEMISLTNHCIYLAVLMRGSLELIIFSLAMQTVTEASSSLAELKKGRWIEASSHILMAGVRGYQGNEKYNELQLRWAIEKAIASVYVGELHEQWQFPSDHLPIGMKVNGVKIVSWNVLNNKYIHWMYEKEGSQGLDGSMITDLDFPVNEDGLTKRDEKVIEMLLVMMKSDTGIIALQESGKPFLDQLRKQLPPHWKCVARNFESDEEIVLYDSSKLTYKPNQSSITYIGYPSFRGRMIQNLLFETKDEKQIRVFNSHIPGDPNLPGREEFAKYVYDHHNENEATVALGDMNFVREEMIDAFSKAGFFDYFMYSPWQTNIDPYSKKSKAIDHFFVKGGMGSRSLTPKELLPEEYFLQGTIDLLRQR